MRICRKSKYSKKGDMNLRANESIVIRVEGFPLFLGRSLLDRRFPRFGGAGILELLPLPLILRRSS
jgi:hypothetical protein